MIIDRGGLCMDRTPKAGEFYRHFKNKLYQIITVASHSETGEPMVVYQALYGTYGTYVRPLSMFISEVDHEKYPDVKQTYRFQKVSLTEEGVQEEDAQEEIHSSEELVSYLVSDQKEDPTKLKIMEAIMKAAKSADTVGKKQEILVEDEKEQVLINTDLMNFLDARSYSEKLEILQQSRKRLTEEVLLGMAMSMDCTLSDGDFDVQYDSLVYFLETHLRFEGNRLR